MKMGIAGYGYVTPDRGFGGHCLPKDTLATVRSAVISASTRFTLLEEAIDYNNKLKNNTEFKETV